MRAELCSLMATTYLLLQIINKHGITNGSIDLYNDSSKAIKLINHPGRKFKRFLLDDYDLLCEIRTSIQSIQRQVSFKLKWVKGHFTGKQKEFQHDLNAEAHNLAKTALSTVDQSSVDVSPPTSLAVLWLGHTLTSNWQQTIREIAHSEKLRHTICKTSAWSEDHFHMVDWESLLAALKGFSRVKMLSYCNFSMAS
jgi:ribonuclease HI